jgi:HlyD family secretion protein
LRKLRKRSLVTVGLLVVAGAASAAFWPGKRPQMVLVARVERLPELKALVNGTGEIRTEDKADIQTEIAGVIIDLPVREGDRVKKDQVLLKIDPFQTEADVQASRASLSALEAEAAGQTFQIASSEANAARDEFLKKSAALERRQAEANQARAQDAYNREKKLLDAKLTSPDQFEVVETQLKVNQAQVEASAARIEQLDAQIKAALANLEYAKTARDAVLRRVEGSRSNLRRSEDLLEKTTIRAPFDGIIVKLNVKKGERAVPGVLSSPQATLMTLADFSVIEAELKVDETDIVNVKIGDAGKVVVDALTDISLAGRVIEIGNSPILTGMGGGGGMGGPGGGQEGKDFKVVLRIDDPPSSLRPGMSCEADITTSVRTDVTVIPVQALTVREVPVDADGRYLPPKPNESQGRQASAADSPPERRKEIQGVFLCEGGKARFRPVKTGIIGETDIEVLEGLSLGEEVVVGPLKALRTLEENTPAMVDRTKPFHRRLHRKVDGEEEPGERR